MNNKDERAKGQDERSVGQSEVDGVVIKPCPFCGNDETNLHFDVMDSPGSKTWVTCSMCNADGPVEMSVDSAIKFWNMRVL